MVLQESEWLEWKQLDVTKEFFKALKKKREEFKENLANDVYENDSLVKGKAMALLEILEMTFVHLEEIRND